MNQKSKFGRVFATVFAVLAILMFATLFYYNNIDFSDRIFSEITECEGITLSPEKDITYNSTIEPRRDLISDRYAKTFTYKDKTYDFYAYELNSTELSKSHFEVIAKKQASEKADSYLNFDEGTPLVTFYENNLYIIYYKDCSYKELAEFVTTLTEPFSIDVSEMLVSAN